MKSFLMVVFAVLLISPAASAQSNGYIGLFADVGHTSWCGAAASVPGSLNMYIYCLPRSDGMYCAEFKLQMPTDPTLLLANATAQAGYSVILGDLASGVSFCFLECKNDWIWIYNVLLIDTGGNRNTISIVDHPLSHDVYFASCEEPDRPQYPAVVFNNFYTNYTDGIDPECEATATAARTWGAIKSMYND
jgi:hypothetical protein